MILRTLDSHIGSVHQYFCLSMCSYGQLLPNVDQSDHYSRGLEKNQLITLLIQLNDALIVHSWLWSSQSSGEEIFTTFSPDKHIYKYTCIYHAVNPTPFNTKIDLTIPIYKNIDLLLLEQVVDRLYIL